MLSRGSSSRRGNRSDATRELFAALEQSPPSVHLIRPLLEAFPRAARAKDAFENYPLHTACSHGAPLEIIQMLVHAYPSALRQVGSEEDYPLHLACIVGASTEIVAYLGNKWIAALLAPNRRQSRPLHLVCARTPSIETIQYMLSNGPAACRTKDNNRDLPLHVACKQGASVEIISLLTKKYPDALHTANGRGDWPLHVAIHGGAPVLVVTWLIEKCPKALLTPNIHGDTPLHIALSRDSSLELLKLLIRSARETLQFRNGRGDMPLHKAILNKADPEVLDLLIRRDPQVLQITNKEGLLPLHLACKCQADITTIIQLIEASPGAASVKTRTGSVPLHFACSSKNANVDVVTLLVSNWIGTGDQQGDEDHQGVSIANISSGDTPLHLACQHGAPRAVIRYLLNVWPEGIVAISKDGKSPVERARRPLRGSPSRSTVNWLTKKLYAQFSQLCQAAEPSVQHIHQLIKAHPDIAKSADDDGCLALHHAVTAPSPALGIVKELITASPESSTHISHDGNTALHMACRALRGHEDSSTTHGELRSIIKVLATTDTVRIKNNHDELAIHIVTAEAPCLEVVQCLVRIWPGSLFELDWKEKTPLDYAEASSPAEDVTKWLAKRKKHEDRFQAMSNDSSEFNNSNNSVAAFSRNVGNRGFGSPRSVALLSGRGSSPPRSFRGNLAGLSAQARRLGLGSAEEQ